MKLPITSLYLPPSLKNGLAGSVSTIPVSPEGLTLYKSYVASSDPAPLLIVIVGFTGSCAAK